MKEKIVVPYAPILVESTRSIGYSFEAAVADIIDNSISAAATEVRVCFMSHDPHVFCQALFPEKSVEIPCFHQGIFHAFGGY